jgi:hypothetical protein
MQVSLFGFGVLGVGRQGDQSSRTGFVEDGPEFTPVEEPALVFGNTGEGGGARFELIEQRRKFVPIAGVEPFGDEGALPVGW